MPDTLTADETVLIHRITRRAIEMNAAWMNVDVALTMARAKTERLAALLDAPDDVFGAEVAGIVAAARV